MRRRVDFPQSISRKSSAEKEGVSNGRDSLPRRPEMEDYRAALGFWRCEKQDFPNTQPLYGGKGDEEHEVAKSR